MSRSNPIDVDRVTKRYGDFLAVDAISFSVREGMIFGLLGPNGAGKTTTIRMIMNIIAPDSGEVRIFGSASTAGSSRRIGYLPEERGLYRKMRVLDHLAFLGEIRGLDAKSSKQKAAAWLERLGLADWMQKRVEELSKGMQQKIQFAGCVIHDPDILILDEPFSGLDPVNARMLKDLLVEYRDQGKTLVLSTHVMEQAEKLCDEIALINRAHIVLEGPIDDVKRKYSGNRLVMKGSGEASKLLEVPGVRSVAAVNGAVEIELDPTMARSEFLRGATRLYEVESVVPHEATLDEVFVTVVSETEPAPPIEEVQ